MSGVSGVFLRFGSYSAPANAMTTQLNGLTNAFVSSLGPAIDNRFGSTLNASRWADFQFVGAFAVAPANGQYLTLYLIPSIDATTYADGGNNVQPAEDLAVGGFRVRGVGTTQTIICRRVPLPPSLFAPCIKNDTGQKLVAANNVLSYVAYTEEISST